VILILQPFTLISGFSVILNESKKVIIIIIFRWKNHFEGISCVYARKRLFASIIWSLFRKTRSKNFSLARVLTKWKIVTLKRMKKCLPFLYSPSLFLLFASFITKWRVTMNVTQWSRNGAWFWEFRYNSSTSIRKNCSGFPLWVLYQNQSVFIWNVQVFQSNGSLCIFDTWLHWHLKRHRRLAFDIALANVIGWNRCNFPHSSSSGRSISARACNFRVIASRIVVHMLIRFHTCMRAQRSPLNLTSNRQS